MAPNPAAPLLLTLHGNAHDAHGFARHWRGLPEAGYRVALPQSGQLGARRSTSGTTSPKPNVSWPHT
ncbi:hypothetical protein HNR42_002243 [Deinobacterium chartae]|uniref:Uncharacterized protein n=1 Tax=Deinobacterium chartae TaxID=521158 RepID=A0A841I371_9DEIO|nr:hypothetical protein [Deinobacterium chartae]MBB6098808.1 hypothetical protein [Deinobacterium chartae]